MKRLSISGQKDVLLKNTLMLYILQFSNYFLSLIVVPYETRVLSPTNYGKLGVAAAIMVYFFNLVVLYFSGHLNMVTLGILVSVAETAILLFRVAVILIHRKGCVHKEGIPCFLA